MRRPAIATDEGMRGSGGVGWFRKEILRLAQTLDVDDVPERALPGGAVGLGGLRGKTLAQLYTLALAERRVPVCEVIRIPHAIAQVNEVPGALRPRLPVWGCQFQMRR